MEYSVQLLYKNLQTNELIGGNFVKHLREYINAKYPDYDSAKTAQIFADAVNKAIDKHISHFDEAQREKIRKSLLHNSMSKGKFAITAADIFEISVLSGIKTDDFLKCITEWVNEIQDIELSCDKLEEIITAIEGNKDKEISFEEMLLDIREDAITYLEKQQENIPSNIYTGSEPEIINVHESFMTRNVIPSIRNHKVIAGFVAGILFFSGINILMLICRDVKVGEEGTLKYRINDNVAVEDIKTYMKITAKDKKYIDSNKLGSEFRYGEIDISGVKGFLLNRGSLLAHEPYFSVIMNISKKYDVSPFLMFAITGQEQNFVPEKQKDARLIANNPFNVYGSWQKFNTNIVEATEIAARTIIDLSKDKPQDYDTIKWINRRYAEDHKWNKGVTEFFANFQKLYGKN